MILIQLHSDRIPWKTQAHTATYSEAVRAAFKAIPGIEWVKDESALNGKGYFSGPTECINLALDTVTGAKIGVIKDHRPPKEAGGINTPSNLDPALYPYQIDGITWAMNQLQSTGGALLADEMGLGKTPQAIITSKVIRDTLDGGLTILVVCPAVVVTHWQRQLIRWGAFQLAYTVLSYEKFTKAVKAGTIPHHSLTIFDEAHYLSNPKAQRTQAASHYLSTHSPMVLLLTGTPILSRVKDLWSLLNLMHPGRWGSKFDFERRYANGHFEEIKGLDRNVWVADGHSNEVELHTRLQSVMLRRTKAEVGTMLPPRVRTIHEVQLPKKALKTLQKAAAAIDWNGNQKATISSLLSDIEAYKIDFAVELANETINSGGKPLILTLRKDTARAISKALSCPCVTGDDDAQDRQGILQGSDCGVATIYSVTTGIDLTSYDTEIQVGLDWLPSTILQGEARIHRIGQGNNVNIHFLVGTGTLDEVVRERVLERLDTFEKVIGAGDESAFAVDLGGGTEDDLVNAFLAEIMK
jgi:SWI/SNF-related matrix-associated actin-dependent regulator of chromatin subfamily A-like protein 1